MPHLRIISKNMFFPCVVSIAVIIAIIAQVALPTRLPNTLSPLNYNLDINLEDKLLDSNGFSAVLQLAFAVSEEDVQEIKLHSKNLTIPGIELFEGAEQTPVQIQGAPSFDPDTDILTITTDNHILATNKTYCLKFNYSGSFPEDMFGLYKASYIDKLTGESERFVTTQFYPALARSVFPSFDEPSFKATFQISVTHSTSMTAFSTSKRAKTELVGLTKIKTTFDPTPKMSTYSLALHVSKFSCQKDPSSGIEICARPGLNDTLEYVHQLTPRLIDAIQKYTGFLYETFGVVKMQIIACPEFRKKPMENWGLASFDESSVLWDGLEHSNRHRQDVALVIARGLGHMWFGNLITPEWWSQLFLSEALVTHLQYSTLDQLEPTWELKKQFIVEKLQAMMHLEVDDRGTFTLSPSIETPNEISTDFELLLAYKGAGMLAMLEHVMTTGNFTAALRMFLNQYQFASGRLDNLWTAFNYFASNLPETVNTVMENWTTQSGFPLVSATLQEDGQLQLSQEVFVKTDDENNTKWFVPVTFETSHLKKSKKLSDVIWLTPDNSSADILIPQDTSWLIVNNQQTGAYYRVTYDDALWSKIQIALKSADFGGIDDISRAQLLDDIFALAKVGRKKYLQAFKVLEYIENDQSYYPWYAALRSIGPLWQTLTDIDLKTKFAEKILALMSNLYEHVKNDEFAGEIFVHKKVVALEWACKFNHEECVNNSIASLRDYQATDIAPDRNLRSVVFCTAIKHSDEIKRDWDFFWSKYNKSDSHFERQTILKSLGCVTEDTALLKELFDFITSTPDISDVPNNDALSTLADIFDNNPIAVDAGIEFLKENTPNLLNFDMARYLHELSKRITSTEQIANFREATSNPSIAEDFKDAVEAAMNRASGNVEFAARFQLELEEVLDPSSTTTVSTPTVTMSVTKTGEQTTPTVSKTTQTTQSTDEPITKKPGNGETELRFSNKLYLFLVTIAVVFLST